MLAMEIRPWIVTISILCTVLISGCASTGLTAVKNPRTTIREYGRILAVFPLQDLEFRKRAEDRIADGTGGQIIPSYNLLFPGREVTEEELLAVILDNQIDAVLFISLEEGGVNTSYVPETSRTRCTFAWLDERGCQATETKTSGGYSLEKPWAEFTVSLFDLGQREVVWYGTAKSRGNAFADQEDLFLSLSEKIVEGLRGEGIIR